MPAISKFLFETSFDAKGSSTAPARPIVRRNFTAAEMEAEKAKAFAEGHKAGTADASKDAEMRATMAFEKISANIVKMIAQIEQHRTEQMQTSVMAAVTMMRKLLPALSRREEVSEIEALIADCLGRLHDEPKIIVRLNEAHVETFRQRFDALAGATGFSGRVAAVADPALSTADAGVEWANGGTERHIDQIWQEIDAIIERFTASDQSK